MTPCLNWRELERWVEQVRPEIDSLFVDRVIVPERPRFPSGYIKGEWAIRLTGRKKEAGFLVSVRPRHPYLTYYEGKGAKAASQATRSPFDLSLGKLLKGKRILGIQTLPQERMAVLWFTGYDDPGFKTGLVLVLIPAVPEALLISAPVQEAQSLDQKHWKLIARSRTLREPKKGTEFAILPQGSRPPADPPLRTEFLQRSTSFGKEIEKKLLEEAFELRYQAAQKSLRHLLKQTQDRLRQSEAAMREAEKEPDWQRYGDLLKGALGTDPPCVGSERIVEDYGTGEKVAVPCESRYSLIEQIEKFYQNSRRKQRRKQEAQSRMERFEEGRRRMETALNQPLSPGDWPSLEKLELFSGSTGKVGTSESPKKSVSAWIGKTFISLDQALIWVGRNKDENLELTFKMAKGNDLWMHVRGRPGAHVVVPLQPGKSVPLETLLDAAQLVIYYSGGASWGKTEVDYTFKKYVKRIKNSTEASYTHNKTLIIEPNSQRLKRLLDQNA